MKRVLSSGSIKLPYIQGSEQDIIQLYQIHFNNIELEELGKDPSDSRIAKFICEKALWKLNHIKFTFEIKMPILVAQFFYNAHLGTLKEQEGGQSSQLGYLPPSFYSQEPSTYVSMDPKSCNELNTKLNNFFNWSFNFYNKLIEQGLCQEQSELVLPQGLFKTFIWEVTAKDLIAFIEQNHDKSPELSGYCGTLVLYMEDHLPKIASWLKRNKWKDLI